MEENKKHYVYIVSNMLCFSTCAINRDNHKYIGRHEGVSDFPCTTDLGIFHKDGSSLLNDPSKK